MRLYITLVILALTMAFGTGYFALSIQGSYTATKSDINEINEIKLDFQKSVEPLMIINFNSLYHSQELFQLLDPGSILGDARHHNLNYSRDEACFKNLTSLLNRENFEKVWIWEEFRCGKRSDLPNTFFTNPPYVHPSGSSYSYLAFKSNKSNRFNKKNWIIAHLPYFHVIELKELKSAIGNLGGIYNFLQTLNENSLHAIAKGNGTILTNEFLMARLNYPSVFSIVEYRIYSRDGLDYFLRSSPYFLQNYKSGKSCFYKDGPLCWDYNARHLFRMANKGSIAVLIGFFIMIILVVRLLIVKLNNQKFDDERRRLALQVLTHEFRTPITSMLLSMERVQGNIQDMDEEMQDSILRISGDIHRLQRLTETSRNYLRVHKSKKLVNIKNVEVPSMNEFIDEQMYSYIEEYGSDKIILELLDNDKPFCLDPYWIGICIKNIMNNALDHGEFPIKLNIKEFNGQMKISIEDTGKLKIDNSDEIWNEFVKGNQSKGTGLGLNIAKKVIKETGGKIELTTNPTCFNLTLTPGKKELENG
jgi:signal transduction histidine kinase